MKSAGIIAKSMFSSLALLLIMSSTLGLLLYLAGTIAAPADTPLAPGSYAALAVTLLVLPLAAPSALARLLYLSPLSRLDLSRARDPSTRPSTGEDIKRARKRLFRLPAFTFTWHAVLFAPVLAVFSTLCGFLPGPVDGKPVVYAFLGLAASVLYSSAQTSLDFRLFAPLFRTLEGYAPDEKAKKVRFGIRFNLNLVFIAALAFCLLFAFNVALELTRAERYQASLVEATAQGRMTPTEAAALSRARPDGGETRPAGPDPSLVAAGILLAGLALACLFPVTADLRRRAIDQRSLLENILLGNDFTQKRVAVVQRDEIGITSVTLNTFIDRFAGILHTIFSSTEAVQTVSGSLDMSLNNASAAIEEMVTAIKQITANADRQMSMVKDTSGKLEEMLIGIDGTSLDVVELSNFVTETSSAMHETTTSMETISKNTEQVNRLANRLVEISQNGSVSVNETVNAIREIEKASAQVSSIVDIISGIAEQTNLLSLNASIEAAHAGDKGKGFAVVADEIRKLAEQSNENIALIAKQVDNMNLKVKAGVGLTTSADEAFRKIHEDIKLTTQHINQVTGALQEQSQGTREIMTALEEMVKKTVEVKEIAEDLKRMSEEIHKFMEELYNISTSINEATGEQDKGNKEILTLITTVKDASQKNLSVVDSLQTVIREYNRQKADSAAPARDEAAVGA
jgi:methyl-accepting chemotaxis protein